MNQKKWLTETIRMLKADLWSIRYVILVLAAYFFLAWKVRYSSCPFVMVTGFPCPGCGLSRAGFSLLRGEFLRAWAFHPFIYGIVLLVIVFLVRRYIFHKEVKSLQKWLVVLIVAMLVFYIYRMLRYFPGEPPMSYYSGNLLNRICRALARL